LARSPGCHKGHSRLSHDLHLSLPPSLLRVQRTVAGSAEAHADGGWREEGVNSIVERKEVIRGSFHRRGRGGGRKRGGSGRSGRRGGGRRAGGARRGRRVRWHGDGDALGGRRRGRGGGRGREGRSGRNCGRAACRGLGTDGRPSPVLFLLLSQMQRIPPPLLLLLLLLLHPLGH